ncbi:MAG: hypothetical protein PHQ72_02140 [Hespellia sp.]|jgi:hypothetical protein|nr:hypothetical protein [Hespellia sp.]
MKDKKMTKEYDITAESLKGCIRKYDRDGVCYLLKKDALNLISQEERTSVIQQMILLRDMRLIHLLAGQLDFFTADMFEIDLNNRLNNDFVSEVLDKYEKKFDFSDEQVCERIFTLARIVGNTKLCRLLMKKTSPSEDAIVETLYQASIGKDAKEQILALDQAGYHINARNSAEETVASLLKKRISKYAYPSGKKGIQMRRADQNTLQFLEDTASYREDSKKSRMKLLGGSLAGIIVIALLSVAVCWYT